MPSQTKTCGTGADAASGGTKTWTSPGSITGSAAFATAAMTVGTTSHWLVGTNFGFTIPAGATITGISISLAAKEANTTGALRFTNCSLWNAGAAIGNNGVGGFSPSSNLGTGLTTFTLAN